MDSLFCLVSSSYIMVETIKRHFFFSWCVTQLFPRNFLVQTTFWFLKMFNVYCMNNGKSFEEQKRSNDVDSDVKIIYLSLFFCILLVFDPLFASTVFNSFRILFCLFKAGAFLVVTRNQFDHFCSYWLTSLDWSKEWMPNTVQLPKKYSDWNTFNNPSSWGIKLFTNWWWSLLILSNLSLNLRIDVNWMGSV